MDKFFLDSADDYNALNDSIDSMGGHDKDIVIAEYEKINDLDNKAKQIYNATSKKTLDLLSSLHAIKFKNTLVSSKNPDLDKLTINLPEKLDIFENLIDDEEAKKLERQKEETEANNKLLQANQVAARRTSLPRSTLKPMDMAYEKLLNLSPVNPYNKLPNKESDADFNKNFKINLIDANMDKYIYDKEESSKENKEKLVQIKNSNQKKSINSARESKYIGFEQDYQMSPIKEDDHDKNLNETIMVPHNQSGMRDSEAFPNKDEKLKKKLNETVMFLKNQKLSNLNVKSSLMGRLALTKDLNTKK